MGLGAKGSEVGGVAKKVGVYPPEMAETKSSGDVHPMASVTMRGGAVLEVGGGEGGVKGLESSSESVGNVVREDMCVPRGDAPQVPRQRRRGGPSGAIVGECAVGDVAQNPSLR